MSDKEFLTMLETHPELWETVLKTLKGDPVTSYCEEQPEPPLLPLPGDQEGPA